MPVCIVKSLLDNPEALDWGLGRKFTATAATHHRHRGSGFPEDASSGFLIGFDESLTCIFTLAEIPHYLTSLRQRPIDKGENPVQILVLICWQRQPFRCGV